MGDIGSEYEKIRIRNIAENRKFLASFGLLNPFKPLPGVIKQGQKKVPKSDRPKKRPAPSHFANIDGGSLYGLRRKSARIQGKEAGTDPDYLPDEFKDEDEENVMPRVAPNRPNFYGAVAGVEVGTMWATRMECCRDGVHRPTVAGIHGGADGAYSIALSGGYEDDIDLGECFTYTGEGGRDLKGTKSNPKNLRMAPQSKDQTLTRGNLALSKNQETGNPVRVIRGYKLKSPFAPEDGYRYDGLYSVEKCWFAQGLSGFGVWKFALKRVTDQAPPPWQLIENEGKDGNKEGEKDSTEEIDNNQEVGKEEKWENKGERSTEEKEGKDSAEEEEETEEKDSAEEEEEKEGKDSAEEEEETEEKDSAEVEEETEEKDSAEEEEEMEGKDSVEEEEEMEGKDSVEEQEETEEKDSAEEEEEMEGKDSALRNSFFL